MPAPGSAPSPGHVVDVVVETPRNSRNKYEVRPDGTVLFDRRLPGAFAFPADYGFVVGALGSDGEPLDVLLLMVEPTFPGVRVRARLIGVFWVRTGHGREAKLAAVPLRDPAFDDVRELSDLPAAQVQEIAHFLDIYRDLDPGKDVSYDGVDDATTAVGLVRPGDENRQAPAELPAGP